MTGQKQTRRKVIIKISTEIKSKKAIQKLNESRSWFFEKINRLTNT